MCVNARLHSGIFHLHGKARQVALNRDPATAWHRRRKNGRKQTTSTTSAIKPGYVSHVTHDFGSILKFTEEVYGLPSLGYADAPADDLADFFDFHQTPLPFQTITAQFDASHFLNDTRPPGDPDDD
jgi:hypothetical protein